MIPFEPEIFGIPLNIHLILEYLAFFIAYRYYLFLRKRKEDRISGDNRLSIVIGAALGAYFGSRIFGILEHPYAIIDSSWWELLQAKTIMGGLFGGLIGVEIAKKFIGEKRSSGDLFMLPIILGIFIGRIGCFLSGVKDFTYGIPTNSYLGLDLGDGVLRHPLALYELLFLVVLFLVLRYIGTNYNWRSGLLFQCFMLSYFSFRFLIEFLKPNTFFIAGLSSIQWLCLFCWLYYLVLWLTQEQGVKRTVS